MSLEGRQKAVEQIVSVLSAAYEQETDNESHKRIAGYILNKLLKSGFLNDKATVYVHEVEEELKQAIFKCKVEE